MQLNVATPARRETKLVSTPTCSRLVDGERAIRVIADAPEDSHPRAEPGKRGRDVSSHAARRFLLHDAIHLPVPGRQAIDLDHDVDVEVSDTEEEGQLFGGLQGGAQASALSAPVI